MYDACSIPTYLIPQIINQVNYLLTNINADIEDVNICPKELRTNKGSVKISSIRCNVFSSGTSLSNTMNLEIVTVRQHKSKQMKSVFRRIVDEGTDDRYSWSHSLVPVNTSTSSTKRRSIIQRLFHRLS